MGHQTGVCGVPSPLLSGEQPVRLHVGLTTPPGLAVLDPPLRKAAAGERRKDVLCFWDRRLSLGFHWLNRYLNVFEVPCVTSLHATSRSWHVVAAGDVFSLSDENF